MLQFHPDDRITVIDALAHPYLRDFHGQMPEPESECLFDFDFEKSDSPMSSTCFIQLRHSCSNFTALSKREVQNLMYQEMLRYRPSDGCSFS